MASLILGVLICLLVLLILDSQLKDIQKKQRQVNDIAKNAEKQRELNLKLNTELEKMGVDLGDDRIIEVIAYLEGDCSADELIGYLEEL